jgi:undecaprenyl phosphate-alpha-L-ara4N flippase subunit ArnE
MTALTLSMFSATILLDVVGQMCFKLGLNAIDALDASGSLAFWRHVAGSPLIWSGFVAYAVELGLWVAVLSRMPLSVVFPLASLGYCGVLLASRYLLGEPISWLRWSGVSMITVGVALVSLNL